MVEKIESDMRERETWKMEEEKKGEIWFEIGLLWIFCKGRAFYGKIFPKGKWMEGQGKRGFLVQQSKFSRKRKRTSRGWASIKVDGEGNLRLFMNIIVKEMQKLEINHLGSK